MIDHDFVQKYYEIYFFGYMDILSIIGGLNASIAPILGMLSPIFIINYLYQLSKIILGKYERQYHAELVILHRDYRSLFDEYEIEKLPGIEDDEKSQLTSFVSKTDLDLEDEPADDILQEIMNIHAIVKTLYRS